MSSRISLCVCSFPSVLSGWAFRLEITKQRRALVLIYSVRSASMVDKENSRTLGFSGDASICPSDKSRNNIEGGREGMRSCAAIEICLLDSSLLLKGLFACSFASAICTHTSMSVYIFYRSNFLFYWSRRRFFIDVERMRHLVETWSESRSNDIMDSILIEKRSSKSIYRQCAIVPFYLSTPSDRDVSIEMAELCPEMTSSTRTTNCTERA